MSLTVEQIKNMHYVDFMATLNEVNRPPGGKDSLRVLVQNTYLDRESMVLDVGCNTGYCTFEIANIIKCAVTGIDLNEKMIASAQQNLSQQYPQLKEKVKFQVADGRKLAFDDNQFDLVMSGGSTAFISNIPAALQEYARVTKPWGFIGDINFFYYTQPPKDLLERLNALMGTNILPWDLQYWMDEYKKADLEFYYQHTGQMAQVTDQRVTEYCGELAAQNNWSDELRDTAVEKLIPIMSLFNENHKYLAYGVFIMRKAPVKFTILF